MSSSLRFLRSLAGSRLHLAGVSLLLLAPAIARAQTPDTPPNVVLVLADDLGWADLACYGNRFHDTPRIDRLAREGLRFTQFYAGAVCSPTRANLQSGRDQARFGITQHIPGHRRPFARLIDPPVAPHLPLEVETFAERLRARGYATGYFGKWHLGGGKHGPSGQGWETVEEFTGHHAPGSSSADEPRRRATDHLAEKAEAFIDQHRSGPFLLQVAPYAVHIPLSTKPALLAKYRARTPVPGHPSRPEYASLVEELDQLVGRIADAVDRAGVGRNTLILFLSDNGGLETQQNGTVVTSNRPLRSEKGTLYEGGIRVPAIARWTGRIPAGTTSDQPAITLDVYPTLLELAGLRPTAEPPLDGVSLARHLVQPTTPVQREALFWHLPHYHHSTPASAIRRGDWKLLEFFEDGRLELYHLGRDAGESTDESSRQPQLARDLRQRLAEWLRQVGARMPVPNPDHDPARIKELVVPRSR